MINVYDAVEIIDGKLYDTSIAREIFSHEKILEKIFVMPKGDYFTAKIESVGENMLLRGKMVYRVYLRYCNITPISQKNVMDIVKQLDETKFRELFAINGEKISRYQKGDIVLSKKFEISQKICIGPDKVLLEPYIDDTWFNRKAIISKIYKEYMDKVLGGDYEDRDEYEITFLNNGTSLAWVDGNDLILISRRTD